MEKKLITFDMSFTYKIIKERNLSAALKSRSLDDYFTIIPIEMNKMVKKLLLH